MADVIAYSSFNMKTKSIWYGTLFATTSTQIDLRLGNQRTLYEGNFTYSLIGEVFGTLSKVTEWDANGALWYSVSNINGDANLFYDAIQIRGDWDAAWQLALQGADTIQGSSGDDVILSSSGADQVSGNAGNDRIYGQNDNDTLSGNDGRDRLYGGAGDDSMDGGASKDKLIGGKGNDTLTGGSGSDVFIFSGRFGKDVITDFNAQRAREDIDLSNVKKIKNFKDLKNNHMSKSGDDVVIDDGRGNEITIEDVKMKHLDASDFLF